MSDHVTLVLVGCNHEIQQKHAPSDPRHIGNHEYLRNLLNRIVTEHEVKLIGEEAKQNAPTLAKQVAEKYGCTYLNIDIPLDIKRQIKRPPREEFDEECQRIGSTLSTDPYAWAWQLVREYHMYSTFLETWDKSAASLLLCGRLHLAGFLSLFGPWHPIAICVGHTYPAERCCLRSWPAPEGA